MIRARALSEERMSGLFVNSVYLWEGKSVAHRAVPCLLAPGD